jgi:hypothetical protein
MMTSAFCPALLPSPIQWRALERHFGSIRIYNQLARAVLLQFEQPVQELSRITGMLLRKIPG